MITHDGLELYVERHGRADAPVTVVLAHCWTADIAGWHYQVRDLLSRYGHDVAVLVWDHRGHGRSAASPAETCTVDDVARDMGDVIDAHAPTGPLVLAGHSLGGMAMMSLTEQRPDLVERVRGAAFVATSSGHLDSVALGMREVGPRIRAQVPRLLAARARLLSRRERRRTPRIERWVTDRFLFGDPMRPRDAGLVVDQIISCPPATMSGFYADFMRHDRVAALAAYDRIPTVVLVGSDDLLTPLSHARRIAGGVRGARLVGAPRAGHMLPLERDRLVSDELIALVEAAATAAGQGAKER